MSSGLSLRLAALVWCACMAGTLADVVYIEPFANTVDQRSIINKTGWHVACSDGIITGEQIGRMSSAAGVGGAQGFAYSWHNRGTPRSVVTWYDGLAIEQADLTGLSAYIGHANLVGNSRFAIRVATSEGDQWYITTASASNSVGAAANFSANATLFDFAFTTAGSAWASLDFNGLSNDTFAQYISYDATLVALSGDLPAGTVTAFGMYHYTPSGQSTRYDDFAITVVPEPASLALLAVGGVLAATSRRKRV